MMMKRKMEKKKTTVNYFSDSFRLIKKNPSYFITPFFIDLGFIFVFFSVYHFFFSRIMDNFINLLMMTGETFQGLAQENPESVLLMQQMNSSMANIFWWIMGLVISIYLIYSIFQSASWFFAGKIINKKLNCNYIKKFFAVNIIWHIILVLILFFYIRSFILTNVFKASSSLSYVRPASFMLIIILSYLSLISYALITKLNFKKSVKECFIIGFKRFFNLLPFIIIFIIIFWIIDLILKLIFLLSPVIMFIAGLIIIPLIINYFRIVLISTIKEFSR
jgi:hypothetical protein